MLTCYCISSRIIQHQFFTFIQTSYKIGKFKKLDKLYGNGLHNESFQFSTISKKPCQH